MTTMQLALCAFMAGSLCFIASTFPRVEADAWHRRWVQRCGAVLFICGSLILW